MENTQPNYNLAKETALSVLRDNFVQSPPVKILQIASNYGLVVKDADFGQDFDRRVSGFIDPKNKIIYLNSQDPDNRKAFTIAYHLGHWLMHKNALLENPNKYAILHKAPLGSDSADLLEKKANFFAAELLVPKALLEDYIEEDINTITKIFGVSAEVIGYRIQNEYGRTTALRNGR